MQIRHGKNETCIELSVRKVLEHAAGAIHYERESSVKDKASVEKRNSCSILQVSLSSCHRETMDDT